MNGLLSKTDMIREMFDSLNTNIHILGVTESKLNSTTLDTEVQINGYFGIWRDRTSGAGGGVIVFVRDDLNFQRPTDLENQLTEAVWLELFVKYSKSILVCFTYRPPNSSEHLNKNFHEVFNNMVMTALQENKEVILLGDLNSDYSKPTDNSRLKDIIKINGLNQMITQPTRITMTTSSLIDIVLTTHVENILQSFVCNSGLSDHDLIGVIRKMNCTKYAPRKLFSRNYKRYSSTSFTNELRSQNWDNVTSNNDFNTAWDGFKLSLQI